MNSYTLADGRELYYREAGSGEPLVLLHGWSMSSAVFQEMMQQLADYYRVMVPDLAGHGHSDATLNNFSHASLATDLEAWIESLGFESIRLLGWSLGGQVALQMALRRQVKIEKLILVSTTPYFVASSDWQCGLPLTQVRAMDRQMQRHYEQSMSEFFRLMFDGEDIGQDRYREIIRFAVREGSLPEREIARKGLSILGKSDFRQQLDAVDIPTLVHYGALDLITVPGACAWLAENIRDAVEVCWENIGHAPFLSRPDASAELWREFLQ